MKKIIILFAIISLYHIAAFGQKKYEMVIEKTDGSEVVISTEDIVRTYFREKETDNSGSNSDYSAKIIGSWDWVRVQGYYLSQGPSAMQTTDLTEEEVFEFRSDGTVQYYLYRNHKLVEDGSPQTYSIVGDQLYIGTKTTYTIKELTDDTLILAETKSNTYQEMVFTKVSSDSGSSNSGGASAGSYGLSDAEALTTLQGTWDVTHNGKSQVWVFSGNKVSGVYGSNLSSDFTVSGGVLTGKAFEGGIVLVSLTSSTFEAYYRDDIDEKYYGTKR